MWSLLMVLIFNVIMSSESEDSVESENFDDDNSFFFETDHLALRGNHDYGNVLRLISKLKSQRLRINEQIDHLIMTKSLYLENPDLLMEKLDNNENLIGSQHLVTLKIPEVDILGLLAKYDDIKDEPDADIEQPKVRGRIVDETKPQSFNRLWTEEEQRRLDELLIEFPAEDVEMRRFTKIANALGNRTALQVSSRVQKYFQKLHIAGMPIPGRIPKNRRTGLAARMKAVYRPTTFFPAYNVSVDMPDDDFFFTDINGMNSPVSVDTSTSINGTDSVDTSNTVTGTDSLFASNIVNGIDSLYASNTVNGTDSLYASNTVNGTDSLYASNTVNGIDSLYASNTVNGTDSLYASNNVNGADSLYASTTENETDSEDTSNSVNETDSVDTSITANEPDLLDTNITANEPDLLDASITATEPDLVGTSNTANVTDSVNTSNNLNGRGTIGHLEHMDAQNRKIYMLKIIRDEKTIFNDGYNPDPLAPECEVCEDTPTSTTRWLCQTCYCYVQLCSDCLVEQLVTDQFVHITHDVIVDYELY